MGAFATSHDVNEIRRSTLEVPLGRESGNGLYRAKNGSIMAALSK
jgi:hypothetical protein